MAAFTLAALLCVDMSDADNQIHIYKAGASVSCSCPSDTLIEEMVDFIVQWLESWSGGYSAGPHRFTTELLVADKCILAVPQRDQAVELRKKLDTFAGNFNRDLVIKTLAEQDS